MLRRDHFRHFRSISQLHMLGASVVSTSVKVPRRTVPRSLISSPRQHLNSSAQLFSVSLRPQNQPKTSPRSRLSTLKLQEYRQILENYRQHSGRWGFVVYRTTYHDDNEWQRVKETIVSEARRFLPIPELVESMDWVFFDDKNIFDGMPRSSLREHFHAWAADAASRTTVPSEEAGQAGRYNFFFEVDEPSLRSIIDYTGRRTGGFMNLVDARWKPGYPGLDGEELEDQLFEDELREPVDGCKECSVGWMKLHFRGLSIGFQVDDADEFHDGDNWERFYTRPPMIGKRL